MNYRDRPSAEQCMLPPPLSPLPLGEGRGGVPFAGLSTVLASLLAGEARRAFEARDPTAFRPALDALVELEPEADRVTACAYAHKTMRP